MMGHKMTVRLDWVLRFETQPYRGEQSGRQIWKGNHIVGKHSLKSATYEDHQNNATYKLDSISLQSQSDLDFLKIHSISQDDLIYKALTTPARWPLLALWFVQSPLWPAVSRTLGRFVLFWQCQVADPVLDIKSPSL